MFKVKKIIYSSFLVCSILNAGHRDPNDDNYVDPGASSSGSNMISPVDDHKEFLEKIKPLLHSINTKNGYIEILLLELKAKENHPFDEIEPLINHTLVEIDSFIECLNELNDKILKEIILDIKKLGNINTYNDSYFIILLKDINMVNLEEKIEREKIIDIITCRDLENNRFLAYPDLKVNSLLPDKLKKLISKYIRYFEEISMCENCKNYLKKSLDIKILLKIR